MALARHTSPGREVGGLERGRLKAGLLPSPARARRGHGDTAAPRDVPGCRDLRSPGRSPAPRLRPVPRVPVSPLSCCDAFCHFPSCFIPFCPKPHFFPIAFPRQDSGYPEHAEVSRPIRIRERHPHRLGSLLRAAEKRRVNYEQARSRATASSEDGIAQDMASEEVQGMLLSQIWGGRCWGPPSLVAAAPWLPVLGDRRRGAEVGVCCSRRECSPRTGCVAHGGSPYNPPLPLALLSTLLN